MYSMFPAFAQQFLHQHCLHRLCIDLACTRRVRCIQARQHMYTHTHKCIAMRGCVHACPHKCLTTGHDKLAHLGQNAPVLDLAVVTSVPGSSASWPIAMRVARKQYLAHTQFQQGDSLSYFLTSELGCARSCAVPLRESSQLNPCVTSWRQATLQARTPCWLPCIFAHLGQTACLKIVQRTLRGIAKRCRPSARSTERQQACGPTQR